MTESVDLELPQFRPVDKLISSRLDEVSVVLSALYVTIYSS